MPMKRLLLLPLLMLCIALPKHTFLSAQLSFGGDPKVAPYGLRNAKAPFQLTVPFNKEDLLATASWNDGMMKVGEVLPAKINFFDQAESFFSHDGTLCYKLTLTARDAQGLSVAFSRFQIPEGGRFYIYTAEQHLGAFTKTSNPDGNFFATAPLRGNEITLQYEAPQGNPPATIEIDHLGYLFRLEGLALRDLSKEGSSTLCEVNVNCPEGDLTRQQQDAVVQIYGKVGKSYGYCTGTVVNNTSEDFTPYILTAAHCGGITNPLPAEDYKAWIFTFHYEKPNCQNNYQHADKMLTLSGCEMISFLATDGKSDGLLLKLTSAIPKYYGVYYAGWDRSETIGTKHIGLHHPNGDMMKVSTSSEKPIIATYADRQHKGGKNAFLNVKYQKTDNGHGVTEGGSSGSPLFNEEGLLVATLTGGASSCSNAEGSNYYGRMAYHWDKYEAVGKSVASTLDPQGGGVATKLHGKYQSTASAVLIQPLQNVQVKTSYNENLQSVSFSWKLAERLPMEEGWKLYIWKEGATEPSAILPISKTQWQDTLEETVSGTTLYTFRYGYTPSNEATPIYFAPRRIALLSQQPSGVREFKTVEAQGKTKLTWKKPIHFQRVTNIAPEESSFKRLNDYRDGSEPYFVKPIKTLFAGSLFNGLELQHLVGKKIAAVGFVTARGSLIHHYSVFVREGIAIDDKENYAQGKDTPETYFEQSLVGAYNELEKREVLLDTPFTIKGNDLLVVGVKTNTETDFKSRALVVAERGLSCALKNGVANHIPTEAKLPYVNTNRWFPLAECFMGQDGLSATSFVLCDASSEDRFVLPDKMPYGPFPVLFPQLRGYKILKDGKEIATLEDPSAEEYTAPQSGNYTIIPLYEGYRDGASGVERVASSSKYVVYPTHFNDELNIEGVNSSAEITIYGMDGKLVKRVSLVQGGEKQTINLGSLSRGEFILVLRDAQGVDYVQHIFKY